MKKINNILFNEITYFLILIIFLICLRLVYFFNSISSSCTFFASLNLFLFMYGLIIWYKKYKTFNLPCIYFLLACFLCWFGQIIVRGFNLLPDSLIEIDLFNVKEFINSAIFLTFGFNLMFLGMLVFYKGTNQKKQKNEINKIENANLKKSLSIVAICLIAIGFFGHYSELIRNIVQVMQQGYASIYENKVVSSGLENIFINLKMFYWPGLFMLLLSNKENKTVFKVVISIACVDVILYILSGARSDAFSLILTFFWLIYTEFRNLSLKKVLVYFVLALFGIKLFNVVHDFRISNDKSIETLISLFFSTESNMFVDFLSEFGFNIFSLYNTMILVPNVKTFAYGYTYFASIMAIIPSLLMGGKSFSKDAALADWLKTTLNMDYGPGFTILAESYYNFGYFGIIVMFFIGAIIGKVTRNQNYGDQRIIKVIIISILFYSNIFLARDTCLMVFRKAVYTIVLPLAFVLIIKKMFDFKEKSVKINMNHNIM